MSSSKIEYAVTKAPKRPDTKDAESITTNAKFWPPTDLKCARTPANLDSGTFLGPKRPLFLHVAVDTLLFCVTRT